MQTLQLPAVLHQIVSQPFQQFRVRGRLGADAEIADSPHQPTAEVMLPNAIDDHARD